MRTNHDRKVTVLAEKYGVPEDKIYSLAAQGAIKINCLTTPFEAYYEQLILPDDWEVAEELWNEFEQSGRPDISHDNDILVDTLKVDSKTFKLKDAGVNNPKIVFAYEHYEDYTFFAYRVLNDDGDDLTWNDCVFILVDDEIVKLEKLLGIDKKILESRCDKVIDESQSLLPSVNFSIKEEKSMYQKREENFSEYLKKYNISINQRSNKIYNELNDNLKDPNSVLDKSLWACGWETFEREFFKLYLKDNNIPRKRGRPRGS